MNQDNLRQQVYFLKRMVSYGTIAKAIGVNPSTFYGWLDGNFCLKQEDADKLQEYITNLLLEKSKGHNKYQTVRNLINLLGEYNFEENEVLAELTKYDSDERYYVTNTGKVFSLCGKTWIKKEPQIDAKGYLYVDLYHNGERTRKRIHQLVVEAFLPSADLQHLVIHHLDQNKQNNNLDNLLPVTTEQHTMIHRYLNRWKAFTQEMNNNVSAELA